MIDEANIRSTVYRSLGEIPGDVLASWENLNGLAFDQTADWYRLLYDHVLIDHLSARFVVLCSAQDGRPLAVAPLGLTKDAALPAGVHCLRSLSNYYSSISEPVIFDMNDDGCVFDELAECIAVLRGEGRYVEIEPVPRDGRFFKELSAALGRRNYIVAPYRRFANWYHVTNGESFDEYLNAREGKTRNTYKRKEKKLRAKGYNIEIATEPSAMDEALGNYDVVYRNSWKITESHPGFIDALCRHFAGRGWLRLGVLKLGDLPIAAQIWFVHGGVASIFKLSYDEEHKSLSAGTVLTMALMQHVLDVDKVAKIDYLTGDDPYKKDYMNSNREMWSLRAYRSRSVAGFFGLAEKMKSAIRR